MKEFYPVAYSGKKEYEVRLELKIFDGTVEDDMNIIHFTTGKKVLNFSSLDQEHYKTKVTNTSTSPEFGLMDVIKRICPGAIQNLRF